MRSCPQCSRLHSDALVFCPEDGTALGAVDPLLGRVLAGQFVLQERIGQGGCGDVYRAFQLGVERPVAIKFLHVAAAREREFAVRFAREARAAARLSHPHIVTVFQLGESEDGLPYIAMEWANAHPLGRGPEKLSHQEILTAASQIASALGEAHEAGIIHRDLKPANVLLGRRGGGVHVTLVDFGIAKIVDAELLLSGETNLTRNGVVYGTPQYLSPEQASDQPLDERADLYSFGVLLYELFAGRLPFESQGVALLVDHLSSKPTHIAELVPDIDPRIGQLIMQMLEKEPGHRPSSAKEVLGRLDEAQRQPSAPVVAVDPERVPLVASSRSVGETRLGLLVAILLWLVSSGSFGEPRVGTGTVPMSMTASSAGMLDAAVASTEQEEAWPEEELATGVEPTSSRAASSPSVPQRALLVSSSGYSMRVLLPAYLGANEAHRLAVELWDGRGRPIRSAALVLVFTDATGEEEGVSARAGGVPGRYEIGRAFEKPGTYAMQVLPEGGGVSLRVHFDVEPEAGPNT